MTATELDLIPASEWGVFPSLRRPLLIAGPCSAESERQLVETARALRATGVGVLRAGLWKPRTHPNCFEGVGSTGLEWMQRVKRELGLKVATEVATARHVGEALRAGMDLLWIGARTSTNPFAVQEIADALRGTDVPVLVKNPVNPDIELWIGALERLNMAGVRKLGAIHRGFSAYGEHRYRNVPQWQLPIEVRRRFPSLPMICDPSHISGNRAFVGEVAQQAMDLGFDGLIVESHLCPATALSDAEQQVTPAALAELLDRLVIREVDSGNALYRATIGELRARIDELDDELLDLLCQRMEISEQIGRYKKCNNITILQPERWDAILANVCEKGARKGLDSDFIEKIFKAIHQASIDRQTRVMNDGE